MRRVVSIGSGLALVAAILAAGCSGGRSLPAAPFSGSSAVRAPMANATTNAATSAARRQGSSMPLTSRARFTITIPRASARRRVDYISAATQSVRVRVTDLYGIPIFGTIQTTARLTTSNRRQCRLVSQKTALRCTFVMRAPAGEITYWVGLYSSTNARGTLLATASVTARMRKGRTSAVAMVPEGVAAKIVASASALSVVDDGATHTFSFSVTAEDASGELIVGPGAYSSPLIVTTNNDPQDALSWSPQTVSAPNSGSNTIVVTYNSAVPLTQGQVIVSATKATSATVTVTPMVVSPSSLSGYLLGSTAQTQTISVSEYGYGGAFTIGGTNSAVTATCVPANCTPASPGATVQVSFSAQSPGSGAYTIADASGTTATLPYQVQTFTGYPAIAHSGNVANVMKGSDGNLWSVLQSGGSGSIARMTTAGVITTYPLPSTFNPSTSPEGVTGTNAGATGLWLVDGASPDVYFVCTDAAAAGTVSSFPTNGIVPTSIVVGPDAQTLYFTDTQGNVESMNGQTHSVVTYTNPYALSMGAASIVLDGSILYFVNDIGSGGNVESMTAGGQFAALPLPSINASTNAGVSGVIVGSDGSLWDGTPYGYLCNQQTNGATVGCYPIALNMTVSSLALGPDGAIWASGATQTPVNAIVRTTTTGATTAYYPTTCCSVENGIVVGPDNALWVAASASGLGRIVP